MSEYEKTREIAKDIYDMYGGTMREALVIAVGIRRNAIAVMAAVDVELALTNKEMADMSEEFKRVIL